MGDQRRIPDVDFLFATSFYRPLSLKSVYGDGSLAAMRKERGAASIFTCGNLENNSFLFATLNVIDDITPGVRHANTTMLLCHSPYYVHARLSRIAHIDVTVNSELTQILWYN